MSFKLKIKNAENVTKARLCAWGFKEIKDFPTDSPCCSHIGAQSILALIASNRWKTDVKNKPLMLKQLSLRVDILKE